MSDLLKRIEAAQRSAGERVVMEDLRAKGIDVAAIIGASEQSPPSILDYKLPCEVRLPPSMSIGKGCPLSTLMTAFRAREKWGDADMQFQDERAMAVRRALSELRQSRENVTTFSNDREYCTLVDESRDVATDARCKDGLVPPTDLLLQLVKSWPTRACPCGKCAYCKAVDYLRANRIEGYC